MKPIQPYAADSVQSASFDAFRRQFQTPRAQSHGAACELAVHLAVYRHERLGQGNFGQRSVGQIARQPYAIAPRRREFRNSVHQRRAEAWKVRHAGELRPAHSPRRVLHQQGKHLVGHLRNIGGPRLGEPVERLNPLAAEHRPVARQLILQVLRQGGRGHEQPHARAVRLQRFAKLLQRDGGFPGAGRSRQQPHPLQCSAGVTGFGSESRGQDLG